MDDKERQARQIAKAFDVPPWVTGIGPVPRWRRVRAWLRRKVRGAKGGYLHLDGDKGSVVTEDGVTPVTLDFTEPDQFRR